MQIKRLKNARQYRPKHPLSLERQYQSALLEWVKYIEDNVKLEFDRPPSSIIRDSFQHFDGNPVINAMVEALTIRLNSSRLKFSRSLAERFAKSIEGFNRVEWVKVVKSVYGVSPFNSNPGLNLKVENWVNQNVALIESIQNQAIDRVKTGAMHAITAGSRHENFVKQLQADFNLSRKRAKLIGRDQVSKLNGQLTETRQTDLGVKSYRWQTAMDERVRATHRANSGKIFKWSSPPPVTGHPGSDYQCRCFGEAIFPEIMEIVPANRRQM